MRSQNNRNEHKKIVTQSNIYNKYSFTYQKTRNILMLQNQVNGGSFPLRFLIFFHRNSKFLIIHANLYMTDLKCLSH